MQIIVLDCGGSVIVVVFDLVWFGLVL